MRILAAILFVLAGIAAVLAVAFNVYIQGLACGFRSTSAPCDMTMPWEMRGEDLLILVILPWSVVAVLLAGALVARRVSRSRDP